MGAWGTGPFDSDAALDYLGDLEDVAGATRNDADELDPASVNHGAILNELRQALGMVGESAGPGEWHDEAIPYAAAGLVAARLTGQSPENTGTRLLGRLAGETGSEDLGLDRHCGYLGLLDQASAEQLRDHAVITVAALRADQPWLDTWRSGGDVVMQLDRLALELSPGRPAAGLVEREPEPEL